MKNYFLLLALCTYSILSFGQIKENKAIDRLFIKWDQQNVPGGAIGIIKDGKLIYAKEYGNADLEHSIKITPSSVFNICSISKEFVAFSILLLEEQGKLNLDDTVQKHLLDFPKYAAPLTIRHLIHHVSGIRDMKELMHLKGRNILDNMDAYEVYELIKNQKALDFLPGEKFAYSNSDYFILSMIIEKASGESLKVFTQDHIFSPLGMNNTLFYDDNTDLIKNRVFSYNKKSAADGFDNLIMRFDLVGSFGAYSTIADLFLWDQNFYNNKLGKGSQEIIKQTQKKGRLNNGESSGNAYGFRSETYKGLKSVEHGGSFAGYRSAILRFPEENFSVIILANRGDAVPWKLSYQVADILLKDKFIDPPQKKKKMIGNADRADVKEKFSLKQISGNYEIEPGELLKFSITNNSLQLLEGWGESFMLKNTKENIYKTPKYPNLQLVFSELNNNVTQKLTILGPSIKSTAKRKEKSDFSNLQLIDYIGDFYSEEIDATHLLFVEDGKLKVKKTNNETLALTPYGIDTFHSKSYFVHFIKTNGKVSGFNLKAGWVTNLNFKKK
nr:serine hydrolase domain-containing protein [uncultured Glaciecola sp.]